MRIYQTIHKYAPHIPQFEKRIGLTNNTKITFSELHKLVIEDGYASSYILKPALDGKFNEFFFTIWDYERLQFLWAKEHDIHSKDLSVIKKAQIDWFQPDVFYNHSAFCDDDFIEKHPLRNEIIKICWYGIIQKYPLDFVNYDIRLSLHKPYIEQWHKNGFIAFELQPSFVTQWKEFDQDIKENDLLFYGQTYPLMFRRRNRMLHKIMNLYSKFKIRIHLTYPILWPISSIPVISDYWKFGFQSTILKSIALPPIYGRTLYQTVGKSKFVLNGYTNFNREFKSNMRLFESIGCGSLLISEAGNYPNGFEAGKHYIEYSDADDLLQKLPRILNNYDSLKKNMSPHIEEIMELYSKENQWTSFKNIILEHKNNQQL